MAIQCVCKICGKTFDYNPSEYGGYSFDFDGNICKSDWIELMELKKRHNQELDDFKNSKNIRIKG
jgi:hypothetical protein